MLRVMTREEARQEARRRYSLRLLLAGRFGDLPPDPRTVWYGTLDPRIVRSNRAFIARHRMRDCARRTVRGVALMPAYTLSYLVASARKAWGDLRHH